MRDGRETAARITALMMLTVLPCSQAVAQSQERGDEAGRAPFQFGAHGGTLGLGVTAGFDMSDRFAVRGLFNTFDFGFNTNQAGNAYAGDLALQSFGVVGDWHPFGGGWRVTGAPSTGRINPAPARPRTVLPPRQPGLAAAPRWSRLASLPTTGTMTRAELAGSMANHVRGFTTAEGHVPLGRTVDDAAPNGLRQEYVDLVLYLAEQNHLDLARIHQAATQSLGMLPAAEPYGGFHYALGRDINRAEWPRVYDLMVRLWPNFSTADCAEDYVGGVRRILAGYGIAWDMDDDGQLHRVMHPLAQARVDAASEILSEDRFADAQRIFSDARLAYDGRPRRDRDACANGFGAMEAVAKVVQEMPTATFHNVLEQIRRKGELNGEVIGVLDSVNTLRNRHFGHGVPFPLRPEEVEFTYTVCVAGIVLLAR